MQVKTFFIQQKSLFHKTDVEKFDKEVNEFAREHKSDDIRDVLMPGGNPNSSLLIRTVFYDKHNIL